MLKKYISILLSGVLVVSSISMAPTTIMAEPTEATLGTELIELSDEPGLTDFPELTVETTETVEPTEIVEIMDRDEDIEAQAEEIPDVESAQISKVEFVPGYESGEFHTKEPFPGISNAQSGMQGYNAVSVPSQFSSVADQIQKYPATRDQSPFGNCWSYSALGMMEYDLINKGLANKSIDFSELHLSYFASRMPYELIPGMNGDRVSANPGFGENIFDIGSNQLFAMRALTSGLGPVNEDSIGMSAYDIINYGLDKNLAFINQQAELKNVYVVEHFKDYDTQAKLLKEAIMKHGMAGVAFGAYDEGFGTFSYPDGTVGSAYCLGKYYGANHAVSIVGWDDSFPVSNFGACSAKPMGPGAWLVRNSWSTIPCDSQYSYFWLSYEELSLQDYAYIFDAGTRPNSRYIYQYDGSFFHDSLYTKYNGHSYAAITFVGRDMPQGKREKIDSVSVSFTEWYKVSGKLSIYEDISSGKPESGALVATADFETDEPGVYSINLKNPVIVTPGKKYSIVIDSLGGSVDFEVTVGSNTGQNQTAYSMVANASGNSYYRASDGKWYESSKISQLEGNYQYIENGYYYENYGDAHIKVLTSELSDSFKEIKASSVSLNKTAISLKTGSSYDLKATVKPANTTNQRVTWTSSATSVATVDTNGKVTGKGPGTATITAKTSNGKTAKCKVTVSFATPKANISTASKSSITISWTKITGASGYYIYSSNKADSGFKQVKKITSGSTVSFKHTGLSYGKKYYYKVVAFKGDKKSSNSNVVNAKTALAKPTLSTSSTATSSSVTIKWKKVADATGYEIYRKASSSEKWKKVATVKSGSTESYTDKKATATSYYRIRTIGKNGKKEIYSDYSAQIITKKLGKSDAKLGIALGMDNCVNRVNWSIVSGATGYEVYCKAKPSDSWKKIKTTTSNFFVHENVPHGVEYIYAVKAYYKNGSAYTYGALGKECKGNRWICPIRYCSVAFDDYSNNYFKVRFTNNTIHPVSFYAQDAYAYTTDWNGSFKTSTAPAILMDRDGMPRETIEINSGESLWVYFYSEAMPVINGVAFTAELDGVEYAVDVNGVTGQWSYPKK